MEEALWLQKIGEELDRCEHESVRERENESDRESECECESVSGGKQEEKPLVSVFNDNQACIASLRNPQFKPSTLQVGVKYFWLRKLVRDRNVEISYVRTDEMVTYKLTKALKHGKHQGCINMLLFSTYFVYRQGCLIFSCSKVIFFVFFLFLLR